jgi:hypothetical protein
MAGKSNGQVVAAAPATELSKKELVRRAIGHLGRDAKPLQIQAHIKAKFGVEMTPNHISASKTEVLREMGGAKATATAAAAPAPAKPAATVQPAVATPATKPATQKQAAQKTAAKKPTSPKPQTTPVIAVASGSGETAGSVALADVQAVKALLARVRADDLKTLIDLLAR